MSEAGEVGPGLEIGDTFAGFEIEAVIGRGGMGTVYKARDVALDSERALKVLDPALARDPGFRERFQRESRMAAAIEDPAAVPIHRAGEEGGLLFIAMRLVRGPDLQRLIAGDGPLEPQRALRAVRAVAHALDAAHARGIVHRDVKPANMLVELGNEGERFYLTDFGIGRPPRVSDPLTSTGELIGTAEYISPEQVDGKPATPSADIYALGCCLFFLLTGEPPFARESTMATLYAHGHAERPRPSLFDPRIPAAVDEVIVRATAVDPAARFGSAGQLADAFGASIGERGGSSVGSHVLEAPTQKLAQRRTLPALAGVLAAIASVAAVAFLASLGSDGGGGGGQEPADAIAVETFGADGNAVNSIVVGKVNVLAASQADSSLLAIDPQTTQIPKIDPVPQPSAVAVGFGSVWVASNSADALLRFGPPNRNQAVEIPVGAGPVDIAVDSRWVWVANEDEATISRVDQSVNQTVETIKLPGAPSAIAAADGEVWASVPEAHALFAIGRHDAAAHETGGAPSDLTIADGSLWVVDADAGTLTEYGAADGEPRGDALDLGGSPDALTAGLGRLWIADSIADTVTPYSLDESELGEPLNVGVRPVALASGDDATWVANAGGKTISKLTP